MPLNVITRIMKKIKLLSVIMLLFAAAGLISCETEQIDQNLLNGQQNGGNNTAPASFKVDFSNETYTASTAQAQVQGTNMAIIGARGTAGEVVSLTIPGGVATGTYNTATMMYVPSATGGGFYSNTNFETGATNGSVTITNINTTAKTVSGTFNFTGYYSSPTQNLPNVAFTNGSFTNVPYTGTIPGTNPPTNPTQEEYYKATVNGTVMDFSDDIQIITSGGFMNLMGIDGSNSISITVNESNGVGTYEFSSSPFPGPTAFYSNGMGIFTSQSGTLTIISKQNGWIKGTFSFTGGTAPDVFEVTNGEFNIEYDF